MSQSQAKKTITQSILDSLQHRVTPAEAELEHIVDGIAFGHIHAEWSQLKAQLQDGDELWHFRTPDETWQKVPHCGLEGYAIIRGGALTEMIFTIIS